MEKRETFLWEVKCNRVNSFRGELYGWLVIPSAIIFFAPKAREFFFSQFVVAPGNQEAPEPQRQSINREALRSRVSANVPTLPAKLGESENLAGIEGFSPNDELRGPFLIFAVL